MSLSNLLKKVSNMLTSAVSCSVYHYWRYEKDFPCVIWAEDSEEGSFFRDNKRNQGISGTIDYFTKDEFDSNIDLLQGAFEDESAFGWELNSVQYEEETNMIHYEWRFWIYG